MADREEEDWTYGRFISVSSFVVKRIKALNRCGTLNNKNVFNKFKL